MTEREKETAGRRGVSGFMGQPVSCNFSEAEVDFGADEFADFAGVDGVEGAAEFGAETDAAGGRPGDGHARTALPLGYITGGPGIPAHPPEAFDLHALAKRLAGAEVEMKGIGDTGDRAVFEIRAHEEVGCIIPVKLDHVFDAVQAPGHGEEVEIEGLLAEGRG